jgi:phosphate starvation-inducible membrane PsiE
MVGTYFKTHRLPVQFLIYIAITALSRHLLPNITVALMIPMRKTTNFINHS